MKLNLKQNSIALGLSVLLSLGISACSDSQSNDPLIAVTSNVEVSAYSLLYQTESTNIGGTFTVELKDKEMGTTTLSGFSASIPDCNVSAVEVDDPIIIDNNETTSSRISIELQAACTVQEVTLSATETNDNNQTIAWSTTFTAIDIIGKDDIISPIANIIVNNEDRFIDLVENNQAHQIILKVWDIDNAPINSGNLKVIYPGIVLDGDDIGTLTPVDSAPIENGEAVFTYVGPSDVFTNIGKKIEFEFYDAENRSRSVKVVFTTNGKVVTNPPVLTGYTVDLTNAKKQPTSGLNVTEIFTITVLDDQGRYVSNEDVISAKITSLQPNIALMYDINNDLVDSLSFVKKNNINLTLQTENKSGLVPFKIELKIRGGNGQTLDLNVTKPVTIFSGPPTAMSLSYANTEQDKDNAKFIEKMVISLTDKWGNPVNTSPSIYAGAIVGYTKHSASTIGDNYLIDFPYNLKIGTDGNVTIEKDGNGSKMTDNQNSRDFSQVDIDNDVLMTFGSGYKWHASGIWDIASVSVGSLTMVDKYESNTPEDEMGYAIGHNYREEICDPFAQEWIAQVDSADGKYKIDASGSAVVDVRYDYRLTGKTIVFGASTVGTVNKLNQEFRIGEAIGHTFRGHGFDGSVSCVIPGGSWGICGLSVHIKDTGYFATHVNFSVEVSTSDKVSAKLYKDTRGADFYNCISPEGIAFVEFNATNADVNNTGSISISIEENLVGSEF